jgi:dTDP-4-dehydrorhamnose reductase
MNILILGASGLVGGNCMRYFSQQKNTQVLGTYFSYPAAGTVKFNTLDLNDPENYNIKAFSPDVILHCGALTWVDYCEQNQEESYQKTVQSTINALSLASQFKAKFVYISTDYVFDGKEGPYTETAPVHPVSVYGKHKLMAEEKVREWGSNHLILRITNVYGDEERNKNFVSRMIENALKNEEQNITLPFDQYATPVNAFDIARALYLLLNGIKTGVYNIASSDYVNRMQLANLVLKYFPQHKIQLAAASTEEINPPAKRPLLGGLIAAKFLSEFPNFVFSNVDDYVMEKIK